MKDPIWQTKVDHTRTQAMRVIRDIRQGYVNELDIDMLQNFVLFSLALMQMEGSKKWAMAKMNAELMSFITEEQPHARPAQASHPGCNANHRQTKVQRPPAGRPGRGWWRD